MEQEQHDPQQPIDINPQHSLLIKVVVVLVVLSLPIIYLLFKKHKSDTIKQTPVVAQQFIDIPTLEAKVQTAPTVNNMLDLSMGYINAKMPGKSIGVLKKLIKADPENAKAYNNLGVAHTLLQEYQAGIDACLKAISLKPDFQLAKNNLKWATDEKNKVIAAIKADEQIPAEKRGDAYYNEYAFNYLKLSEYDKAIDIWQQGMQKNSKNLECYNGIGTALVLKGEYDKAIAEFNKVLQIDVNNQLAKNNITWAMQEKTGN